MTYKLGYTVFHAAYGTVTLPDQVVERMALWDALDMPCTAIDAEDNAIEIRLVDTDA